MEVGGVGRRRVSRETSPDRARVGYLQRSRPTNSLMCRKVQIIYYLSRNGQLEHPHFMELSYLPNQHLRLKDVMDRLTVLRGRGMPSLYSWSCKRSYKNGYVWNDLSENDVIYPADGAEYVLKGSEIIQAFSERFQQLQVSGSRPRLLPIPGKSRHLLRAAGEEEDIGDDEDEVEEMEDEEKGGNNGGSVHNNSSSGYNTPYSRCSRGVSTDETEQAEKPNKTRDHHPTEIHLDDTSPPSTSSSEKAAAAPAEDGDSENEPGMNRNSVLMQLIACGSVAVKGKSAGGSGSGRKSGSLHKGLLSRLAIQMEDKEYFSGSIVETITESNRAVPQPALKKSSSYNEEGSSKAGIGEGASEDGKEKGGVRGKCIPGRKRNSCNSKQQEQQQRK